MGEIQANEKKGILKTALLAVATVGLYTAVFANEATVTTYFTRGGVYAALPVLTAFAFSIVHGSFASQCLETLGLTASKSTQANVQASKKKQAATRKDQRPRVQAN